MTFEGMINGNENGVQDLSSVEFVRSRVAMRKGVSDLNRPTDTNEHIPSALRYKQDESKENIPANLAKTRDSQNSLLTRFDFLGFIPCSPAEDRLSN